MANDWLVYLIEQGVEGWNKWKNLNPRKKINLSGANLREANLSRAKLVGANLNKADLSRANLDLADLSGANLREANLSRAKLVGANLTGANLYRADLREANLNGATLDMANLNGANLNGSNLYIANLIGADLVGANLRGTNLSGALLNEADLSEANLQYGILVGTSLNQATLTKCKIYGISAWSLRGVPKDQSNLIITRDGEAEITLDDLQVAQFIYLLYDNPNIRNVISTMGRKSVLILGRFTPERKIVLEAIKQKLRENNFLPILFDFEKAVEKDFTETVKILAGLSRFVIADLTNPQSIPKELEATVPYFMIPFVPIIQFPEKPFSMFIDLQKQYHSRLLDLLEYPNANMLIEKFETAIINRVIEKEKELLPLKVEDTIRKINLNEL